MATENENENGFLFLAVSLIYFDFGDFMIWGRISWFSKYYPPIHDQDPKSSIDWDIYLTAHMFVYTSEWISVYV